jgi:transcriptional regulator with XRE-family HTH domain
MLYRIPNKRLSNVVQSLKEIRLAWQFPVSRIAAKANVQSRSILHWEAGQVSPTIRMLEKYADALGYEIVLRPKQ